MSEDPTLDRLVRLLNTDREGLPALLDGVSEEQREAIAEHVADSWESRDEKTLKAVLSLLGVLPDVVSANGAPRPGVRRPRPRSPAGLEGASEVPGRQG